VIIHNNAPRRCRVQGILVTVATEDDGRSVRMRSRFWIADASGVRWYARFCGPATTYLETLRTLIRVRGLPCTATVTSQRSGARSRLFRWHCSSQCESPFVESLNQRSALQCCQPLRLSCPAPASRSLGLHRNHKRPLRPSCFDNEGDARHITLILFSDKTASSGSDVEYNAFDDPLWEAWRNCPQPSFCRPSGKSRNRISQKALNIKRQAASSS